MLYFRQSASQGARPMKFARLAIVAALIGAGGAAVQADPTDPNAILRANVMKDIGGAMKVLGDIAGGKTAYDAAAAEAAKAKLVADAAAIPEAFKTEGAADPESEAKPEIWTGWDDFLKKAGALEAAAGAADVGSVGAIKASMGALGGACKDCHTTYRTMKM
ncbi:cytochrome C [Fuscovulum blasticum DSM 2131]|uniref:Cytochrome C n=2 Tax=Fuscovulum blasticum TaxID=1075 RepID=A0A2T4JEU9_FUSBL|nr:cytochrome C [Fuscovulum blasticum DSM 2131]